MVDWESCDLIDTDCRPPCVISVSVATKDAALATT
jgi:hypothetical protein